MGVVPRTLDTLGQAQEVYIFGSAALRGKDFDDYKQFYSVRIVGAIIREECREYPCNRRERWLSNVKLIGVNLQDRNFAKIKTMAQLKHKVYWPEAHAWMLNGFGVTLNSGKARPTFRITREPNIQKVLAGLTKAKRTFEIKEQQNIVKGCSKLYEHFWQGAEKNREYDPELRKKSVGKKKKKFKTKREELAHKKHLRRERERERLSDFASFFRKFHKKYAQNYKTCMRYVRPASVVKEPRKFWLFTFIDLFMWLEELGMTYSCSSRSWIPNSVDLKGKKRFNLGIGDRCNTAQLDSAFERGLSTMTRLRMSKKPYMRFITYDSGYGASHNKIYGWVYENGRGLVCLDDMKKVKELEARREYSIPRNINWVRFNKSKNSGNIL